MLKLLLVGEVPAVSRMEAEIHENLYFYTYMTVTTPVAFMVFGGYLGNLIDRIRSQNSTLQHLMAIVQKQSVTDEATGVYNRRHLFAEIQREIVRSARYGHALSGIMVDLDSFKEINDRYGHPAGDLLLRQIADAIAGSVRNIDTVGRYGGDEFFILMPESGSEGAVAVAERVLQSIQECRIKDIPSPPPTCASIGIASFAEAKKLNSEVFIGAVDKALLRAKSLGKNRIEVTS